MPNISSIVKNVRNIMRDEDPGISGDAQRLEQLGWMLFLKILDEKDQELELIREGYTSVIPEKFQWRNWATDPEGITGDELLLFINHPTDGLFICLTNLQALFLGCRPVPFRQTIAAKTGQIHQIDILHLGMLGQMLNQTTKRRRLQFNFTPLIHCNYPPAFNVPV